MPRGSVLSASIGQHTPSRPVSLHDRQGPWQATLQQTPSAQKFDAQSSFTRQGAPFMRLPQLPFTHCWPKLHWLLLVQVSAQLLVAGSHVNGTQMTVEPGLHLPAPSHAYEPTTASPSHVPGLHIVVTGYFWQPPSPSHRPFVPQVDSDILVQADESRGGSPAERGTHVPSAAVDPQVLQPSVQAVLQQTPSTQWLLPHWASHAQ